MMNNPNPIQEYLVPGKRVHLVGIGGVSMCPLAEVLRGAGMAVQGSDMSESDTVKHLHSLGIPVSVGHNAENLGDCDLVVRTAAVHDSTRQHEEGQGHHSKAGYAGIKDVCNIGK